MERISKPFNGRNYWNKKGYNLLDGAIETKRNIQVVKFNGGPKNESSKFRRFWRIKKTLKFSLKKAIISSPKKLWKNFKNGYINMMLKMAGGVGQIDGVSEFERRKTSQSRTFQVKYKNQDEFEARLVLEIYKALSTSKGLSEVA
ncbi:hypothetical protein SOVF_119280 [Spinacia oleracea]|uniref:Uncharacterized protein n=1 Tax=Spinacia oleracea TaxID=3562 RepID=A0ABM3R5D5_SPIOL|nr:uncharacterized protein LOC130466151 [Spinacia oleracea]KNA13161.1 hypothetical protein SOVF_119280 [Spinacia oleracea]